MDAPLAGIRVVEVASYVAVPAAGALLADMGADVVKVENPKGDNGSWVPSRLRDWLLGA